MVRVSLFGANGVNIERHAYCLCLHVRPTTIFFALINLVSHFLDFQSKSFSSFSFQGGSLICACFTLFFMINNEFKCDYLPYRFIDGEFNRVTGISVMIYLLLALVSAMLLYGVIKSKPSYILPFFGIQFIEYLFTMPKFLASFYSHPYHYHKINKMSRNIDIELSVDMRNNWLDTSDASDISSFHIHALLFMTLVLVFKTYFLCVVWKCYRYLHMKEFILPLSLNTTFPTDVSLLYF